MNMENIVVIVSSVERTKKLLTYASEMAKTSGSKVWLVCDLKDEKGGKDHDKENSRKINGSIKGKTYSVPVGDSKWRNSKVAPYMDELNSKGVHAEPLFVDKLNMKDFLNKVLIGQIVTTKSGFLI